MSQSVQSLFCRSLCGQVGPWLGMAKDKEFVRLIIHVDNMLWELWFLVRLSAQVYWWMHFEVMQIITDWYQWLILKSNFNRSAGFINLRKCWGLLVYSLLFMNLLRTMCIRRYETHYHTLLSSPPQWRALIQWGNDLTGNHCNVCTVL